MRTMTLALAAGLVMAYSASAETIKGEYLESRNADVWTGPCFANSEMGIVGNKAVLAWKVNEGIYDDVKLDGLGVAAVVMGNRTFGIGDKVVTKTVFLVDERANETARRALINMATALAGDTIQNVVAVHPVKFSMETSVCHGKGCATLDAGVAKIRTRCLTSKDCICGHEDLAYEPLSKVANEYAAFTLENVYDGRDFNETFKVRNARSAIIATFAL